MEVIKRGYFPQGGGHIRLHVPPLDQALQGGMSLNRISSEGYATCKDITIQATTAGKVPERVSQQMSSGALDVLR